MSENNPSSALEEVISDIPRLTADSTFPTISRSPRVIDPLKRSIAPATIRPSSRWPAPFKPIRPKTSPLWIVNDVGKTFGPDNSVIFKTGSPCENSPR